MLHARDARTLWSAVVTAPLPMCSVLIDPVFLEEFPWTEFPFEAITSSERWCKTLEIDTRMNAIEPCSLLLL